MTFFVCGSSFTSGAGLTDRENQRWTKIFSQLTNQKVVNTATDGASIELVLYTTINQVLEFNYKNIIITWPPLDRILLVRRENNFLINGNVMLVNAIYSNSSEFVNFLKLYYKYWINDLYTIKLTLQKILLLQEWLKNQNCKYLFINTNSFNLSNWLKLSNLSTELKKSMLDAFDVMDDAQILKEQNEISLLVSKLDLNFYDPINYNLETECFNLGLIDSVSLHPTEKGHKHIASYIFNSWNQAYQL